MFHASDKLCRHEPLTLGFNPFQQELNAALLPVFARIPNTHLIHDDLIVAAPTDEDHDRGALYASYIRD